MCIFSFPNSLLLLVETSGGTENDTRVQITAGAQWKELPETISYEATIPLNYETPWTDPETVPQGAWRESNECSSGHGYAPGTYCYEILRAVRIGRDADEYLSRIQKSIVDNLINTTHVRQWDSQDQIMRSVRALDFIGDALTWCCGVATQRKVESMSMKEDDLVRRMKILNRGVSTAIRDFTQESEEFHTYAAQNEEALQIIATQLREVSRMVNSTERAGEHGWLVLLQELVNGVQRDVRLTLLTAQQNTIQSCRLHHIPMNIVTPAALGDDLQRLEEHLHENQHEIAIDIRKSLARLYELPITDCVFAGGRLTVHIKVPIARVQRHWRLYELITTPFAWKNSTCTIVHDIVYLAVSESNNIRPVSGTALHHCHPYDTGLCYLPRFSSDTINGHSCAFSMFHGSTVEYLSKQCPLRCHESTATVITEVGEDMFVITHPKKDTVISCPSITTKIPEEDLARPGALKMYIPCKCSLIVNSKEVIAARYPCETTNSSPKLLHTLPAT